MVADDGSFPASPAPRPVYPDRALLLPGVGPLRAAGGAGRLVSSVASSRWLRSFPYSRFPDRLGFLSGDVLNSPATLNSPARAASGTASSPPRATVFLGSGARLTASGLGEASPDRAARGAIAA